MYETLIFAILLIIINLILTLKPVPILALPVSFLTLIICGTAFFSDTTLPVNNPTPYFTLLVATIAVFSLIGQVMDIRKK